MALLMVHLLVADAWAKRHAAFSSDPEFFLGAISPDAIHVRDHDDKSHKNEIHLQNWNSLHEEPLLAYWREHRTPFDVGYGIHVLTDAQWVPRYRTRLPQLILADGWLDKDRYYNETYATDFELYRSTKRLQALLELLMRARVPEDHPLLTKDELDGWRKWMWGMYTEDTKERPVATLLTKQYVYDFVQDAQELLDRMFEKAGGFA